MTTYDYKQRPISVLGMVLTGHDAATAALSDGWSRVPTCVREHVKHLGVTTMWSALDWFAAMDAAVGRIIERKDAIEAMTHERRAALRRQLFDLLGEMTVQQMDKVARVAVTTGFALRAAVDTFELALGARDGGGDHYEYKQRPIDVRGVAITDTGLVPFGPRGEVPQLSRPGRQCLSEGCPLNTERTCGAGERQACPGAYR